MKIKLITSEPDCRQTFVDSSGRRVLLPGQDFRPVNDLFENRKCLDVYVGPVIDDDLECNPGCPAEGSEVVITILDEMTGLPISGANLHLSFDGVAILTGISNAQGVIEFNVPYRYYNYQLVKDGYLDKSGILVVDGCVTTTYTMEIHPSLLVINPFNIHGFLTVPGGSYSLAAFFGVPLNPVIPPFNAYRTKWRIVTDACGFNIQYYLGDMDDSGRLLTTGTATAGGPGTGFDPVTKSFLSSYPYAEGMYLQLGVLVDNELTWVEASPCIGGGSGTPITP